MSFKKIISEGLRKKWRALKSGVKRELKYNKHIDISEFDKTLYWIDPRDIRYAAKSGLHIIEKKNKVLSGKWDDPYYELCLA